MLLSKWPGLLQWARGKRAARQLQGAKQPSCILRLEHLEDRVVPAVYAVQTLADNSNPVITAGHAGTQIDPFLAPSLRSALTATNAAPGADTITFLPGLANQTIVLNNSLPALATNMTITAAGVPNVTVSGANAFQVFVVNPNVQATIDSLRITSGLNTLTVLGSGGGGITVNPTATLTLTNCTVTGNAADANFLSTMGGGILNEGTLSATNCFITNNTANDNLSGSSAGGIANQGILNLTDCVVSGNQTNGSAGNILAGGIINVSGGVLNLSNCDVTDNVAVTSTALTNVAGGVATNGTANVNGCYFADNSIQQSTVGTSLNSAAAAGGFSTRVSQSITNSTFASNQASGSTSIAAIAGGISAVGNLQLTNVTVAGNGLSTSGSQTVSAGGIAVSGTSLLTNCTVASNTATESSDSIADAGGIATDGALTLANTIVAGNTDFSSDAFVQGPDIAAATPTNRITANNSLIGSAQGNGYQITSGTGNLTNTDPLLDPTGVINNGGRVPTLALVAGSPAIDAGTSTGAPPTDERGVGRIGAVDIGAFELDNVAPTATLTTQAPNILVASGNTGTNTVTITYADVGGINTSTFATSNITVDHGATVTGFSASGNVVTYTITAPATWNASFQGTYTIALVAGSVKDIAGNSVAGNTSINTFTVDTVAPTIASVTSTTADGAYKAGALINVTVNFSEAVTLTGSLTVNLDTGGSVIIAAFSGASASGTYTVAAGENSADLNSTSLTLSGGATLRDAAGNDATLTIPGGKLLADLKNIVVDTTPPTVTIVTTATSVAPGGSITFTVTYADANIGTTSNSLKVTDITLNPSGTAHGTIKLDSNSGATRTVTISGITGTGTLGISLLPKTAIDKAGNQALAAGPSATVVVRPNFRFDMKNSTKAQPTGWNSVLATTAYSSATGYGWVSTKGLTGVTTPVPSPLPPGLDANMYGDAVMGSSGPATFRVFVGANQSATVRVYSYLPFVALPVYRGGATVSVTGGDTGTVYSPVDGGTVKSYVDVAGHAGEDGILDVTISIPTKYAFWAVNGIDILPPT